MSSLALILPNIRPLAGVIEDPEVSEIMVNPNGTVYVERGGAMELHSRGGLDQRLLLFAVQRIAREAGQEIDEDHPYAEARFPDGSRVAAAIPPCAVGGIQLTIRKFRRHFFDLNTLTANGTVPPAVAATLRSALANRENILISGQTGSGKTSLQAALLNEMKDTTERIGVIEESAEMQIDAPNVFRLECNLSPRKGFKPVTIRDLLKISLRHRPDRLVVGEVRGAEALDLLDALNTGHAGSMTTIHANNGVSALTKLSNLALRAGGDVPHEALQAQIADTIRYVVQMRKEGERRYVAEFLRVERYDLRTRTFSTQANATCLASSEPARL